MNSTERMSLIMLQVRDLEEAVKAYAKAKKESPYNYVYAGNNVPLHHSKEAIERRILQIRQDLNVLREELRK